jgi:hypothetical protein
VRVSDSRRVVFVHVPKTGGSTVDRMFDDEVADARKVDGAGRHWPYSRLLKREPALADYWSFGFVRNPWARMVSWWSMAVGIYDRADAGYERAQRKIANFADGGWLPELAQYRHDFSRFVMEAPDVLPRVGRPQVVTLSLADDRPVDFIGRTERFADDMATVRERLGLPPVEQVRRHNASRHGHYRDYYDDVTRQRVAEVYAADIDAFGYTF